MTHTSSSLNASLTLILTNGPATDVSSSHVLACDKSLIFSPVMTFSAGPRGCIGKQFAYVEATVALALIVRNFELFPIVPDAVYGNREELRRALLGYVPALSIRPTMTKVVLRRYIRQAADCEDV